MNRFSKTLVIFAALVIWYALIGFWIAPALIRHFGEQQLQARFSPDSTIAKVRINPFSGAFRVEGLQLADAAGAWSLDWQTAELNLSAATFVKFYPVLDVLRLAGAELRYEKRPGLAQQDPVESVDSDDAGDWRNWVDELNLTEVPELRVDLLEVSAGRVEFVDLTAATTYHKVVDPIDFTLRGLTTVIEGDTDMRFVAEMDDGAVLTWQGDFQSRPIRSAGAFSLSGLAVHDLSPYYSELIRFDLKRAVFGLRFDYVLDLSSMDQLLELQQGQVSLNELLCEPIGQSEQLISVDAVSLDGIGFRFPEMALEIASITVSDGATRIARDAKGEINLAHLLVLPAASEGTAPEEPTPEPAARESLLPALTYQIGQLSLSDYRIVWEEVLAAGLASLTVEIPQMTLTSLSSDLSAPIQLQANYLIGESGSAHIAGSIVPMESELDLSMQLQGIPLQLLSPYTQNFATTQIESGTFGFDGRFEYAASGSQSLTGNASILGMDLIYDENLHAKWQRLQLSELRLDLAPFSLAMDAVVLDQPEIIFTQQPSTAATASEAVAEEVPAASEAAAADSGEATPIRIDTFAIAEGSITYVDQSMEPAPRIVMDEIGLMLRGLDLAGSEPAELDLNSKINGSRFELQGGLNLSRPKESTRLQASLSGLSLPGFSTYSGQAVGRRIASGTFNLDSDWVIEASQLKASNQIRIEQLELGDRVESENAVSLPLDLAVTLLKGPNGVMNLSLPLSGDLNDPKVGIGQIVRTAIVGLITNVAAAPFKLLSGLVPGGEEDLSRVRFDSGSGELKAAMVSRLNTLATALKERPGLKLAITPQISADDERVLAEEQLRMALLGDAAIKDEALYRKRLTQRYREFSQAGATPELVASADDAPELKQMVAALLPSIELTDTDRAHLATTRAVAIREHLVTAQGITPDRLSVGEPELGAGESGARFDLK
ncbi:DUF748 domain-containing protein [Coraliomargarita sp. SDUM461003]|uniref:DUF748 domain-containing protein n=1 Tax=Thalassobacterium maritimum TaxID=3041265 RepID=A0ABU1AY57_9BACT|nr:DUF748 domain-containing protein [Coraliomargarita sp. SDUM461003]MDQ8209101.1 DUF748 domain-containing protein [Coraliomargarita sp. SDUM461003]